MPSQHRNRAGTHGREAAAARPSPSSCSDLSACALPRQSCDGNRCTLLHDVCLFNATLFHRCTGMCASKWQEHGSYRARAPWNSHATGHRDTSGAAPPAQSLEATLDAAELEGQIDSACAPPLVWTPVWAINFAETFLNSVVPLFELERRGALVRNRSTVLVADMLHHYIPRGCVVPPLPLKNCTAPGWFLPFLRHVAPTQLMHEIAPPCTLAGEPCHKPKCFSHLRACSLRSTFNGQPSSVDVWSSAQRLIPPRGREDEAAPLDARNASAPSKPPSSPLRVLIEVRNGTGARARRLANWRQLVGLCASQGAKLGVRCQHHIFGVRSLEVDVERARDADVIVGMHGAGLTHAFFMRRHSAVIEVRPYGFHGRWPDAYFKDPLLRPHGALPRVFHQTIEIGSPELCKPNGGYSTGAQGGNAAHQCTLPWDTLQRALRVVAWWRRGNANGAGGSTPEDRYLGGPWATRTIVAYAPT